MARPKTKLPPAGAIMALADEKGRIAVKVTPGARHEEISIADSKLLMKVHAPPDARKANKAVLALIAKALGCAPSRLTLVRGETSREKLIRIG